MEVPAFKLGRVWHMPMTQIGSFTKYSNSIVQDYDGVQISWNDANGLLLLLLLLLCVHTACRNSFLMVQRRAEAIIATQDNEAAPALWNDKLITSNPSSCPEAQA